MRKIDLHTHTNASDGELSPYDLADMSIKNGLMAIAITDHDTIDGIQLALDYSCDSNIEIVSGIEISCEERERGFDEVHILGLFIDYNNKKLLKTLQKIKHNRIEQKKRMIIILNELGFDISFSEVSDLAKHSLGRAHIAYILLKKYPVKFDSIQDIFDKYLSIGRPAYVERTYKMDVKSAINVIKKAEGITFLAHPGSYPNEDALELIEFFELSGGQGIETSYPYSKNIDGVTEEESKRKNELFKKVAREKDLLESGGTDFHRGIRKVNIGEYGVNISVFQKIKQYKENLSVH